MEDRHKQLPTGYSIVNNEARRKEEVDQINHTRRTHTLVPCLSRLCEWVCRYIRDQAYTLKWKAK